MKTHYDILGVSRDADYETIKAAYRKILKENHPDLHEGDSAAEERSKQIIHAYAALKDPGQRALYDQALRSRRQQHRRLLLITLLSSAMLASLGSFGLLYALLAPDDKVVSAKTEAPVAVPETAAVAEPPAADAAPMTAAASPAPDPQPTPASEATPGGVTAVALSEQQPAAPEEIVTNALPESARDASPQTPSALAMEPPSASSPQEQSPPEIVADAPSTPQTPVWKPASSGGVSNNDHDIASLDEAIRLNPADTPKRLRRAAVLAAKGFTERALADYNAAIEMDKTNITAFHERSLLLHQFGDTDNALADLDRAIRLSFSNAEIYRDRGLIWYEKERYDRAIADFDRAIKLAPDLASAYFFRGLALQRKGDAESAAASFAAAIRLDPTIAQAYEAVNTLANNRRTSSTQGSGALR